MPRTIVRAIPYRPLPSQLRFHQSSAKFKIFIGPVGSGKSAALAQECIRLAVLNVGLPGLLGAPTYRMLEDVTKPALINVLVAAEIPHVHAKADNTITLTELNVKILCRSLEDPDRLVGTNLAWFAIDEQTFTKEAAFFKLQARLRHPLAKKLCGFGAATPRGFDWTYERYVGEKKTEDFEAIRAIPRENYHLPSDYYDVLARSYDEQMYRQEAGGEFISLAGGASYYAFDRSRNIDSTIDYDPGARVFWSLDFNVTPMCSVFGQITTREISGKQQKAMEVLDEISIRDGSVNLACSAFVDRTKKWTRDGQRLKVNLYGDPAGNSRNHAGKSDWQMVADYMGRYPEYHMLSNVASSHSLVRDRVNAVNGALFNAIGESRVFIHPRCTGLIKDLERVVWKKDSHGNTLAELDKGDPALTHLSDAAGYSWEREFPLAKRIYVGLV